jgi:hypothetical protein
MVTLKYPLKKLFDDDDWFSIQIYKHKPGEFSGGSDSFSPGDQGAQGPLLAQICLPMPWNIPNNGQAADWGTSNINALQAGVANVAQETIEGGVEQGLSSLSSAITNLKREATSGNSIKTLTTAAAAAAANALGGLDPAKALSRFAGVTFNDNVELSFSGIQPRPANNFSFSLTPRNQDESKQIRQIIKILKENMSPSRGSGAAAGGIFLSVPNVFQIKYMKGKSSHPFLNKFKICALASLSVDLSPNGYATYDDATPVEMVLTLAFNELTPIYREDYAKDESTTISY